MRLLKLVLSGFLAVGSMSSMSAFADCDPLADNDGSDLACEPAADFQTGSSLVGSEANAHPNDTTYTPVTTAYIPGGYTLKWVEYIPQRNEFVEWVQFGNTWHLIGPDGSVRSSAVQTGRDGQMVITQDQGGGVSTYYANGTMVYRAANGQTFTHSGVLYKKPI